MKKSRVFQLFVLVSIFLFALFFVVGDLSQAQSRGKEKPETPPGKDKGKPTPSAPLLDLYDYNIVTAEPYVESSGTDYLHVWGYSGGTGTYEKIWTAEGDFNYTSVAIGDLDGDGITREIVALTKCEIREKPGKGPKLPPYYKYYINVYKEGFDASDYEKGIWRTTFYDGLENNIKETTASSFSEIKIADVDGDFLNEVVLLTTNYVAIFKYDDSMTYAYNGEELGAFKRIALLNIGESSGVESLVKGSLACGDIDEDGSDEIIVSANVEWTDVNQSYIFAYDYSPTLDSGLEPIFLKDIISARIWAQSLRIADLDGDGSVELCSPAHTYDESSGLYKSYVFIWEQTEEGWFEERYDLPVGSGTDRMPFNHLDTGELISTSDGDEIVYSTSHKGNIIRYECFKDENGDFQLALPLEIIVDPGITGVIIADADGSPGNEIVVYGGRLEVYSSDLTLLLWSRIEEADDGEIWYAAVGGPIIQ